MSTSLEQYGGSLYSHWSHQPFPSISPVSPVQQASSWELSGWDYREFAAPISAPTSPANGLNPLAGSYMNPRPLSGGYRIGNVSTVNKRPLEFNHNKAITKKLASAVHYQQVLDTIADSAVLFDEVNVATALHRLAKLHAVNYTSHASLIVRSEQFRQLTQAIKKLLPRFEAQAVSNTLWAFATLAYYPDTELLDAIAEHAVTIMHTFKPQATSNTLWAYAKLGYSPPELLLKISAQQMVHDLSKSVPQDISNTLWAFATLRHYPGPELMDGAARQALYSMHCFKPQEIANTLWSYATLGHDPGNSLLDAIALQMVERIQHFRPQAVSNSLWAYAKLNYNPGPDLLDVAARKAVQMLHQYTSQEIANTLWAVATLEHHPGNQLLDAAALQIARRIEQFSPQDTTNSVWAYAKLFHYPCNELLHAAAMYTLRHWHRFKPQEIANMFWALAILKACPPETWRLLMEKLASVPLSSFDEADQQQVYQAYILLDGPAVRAGALGLASPLEPFPLQLVESAQRAWKAGVRRSGRISKLHQEVSRVLWDMGLPHENEYITPDGLFCVDIALQDGKVLLEVEGPSHFSANSHRPLGRTVSRRCMLEGCGYTVRSVPFYEWNALEGNEAHKAYLTRLLQTAYAFA